MASFVHLAAGLAELPAQAAADGPVSPQTLVDRAAAESQAVKAPLAALQKADLLAPVGLPELSDSAAFKELAAAAEVDHRAGDGLGKGLLCSAIRGPTAPRSARTIDRLEKIKALRSTATLPESAVPAALVDQRITAG